MTNFTIPWELVLVTQCVKDLPWGLPLATASDREALLHHPPPSSSIFPPPSSSPLLLEEEQEQEKEEEEGGGGRTQEGGGGGGGGGVTIIPQNPHDRIQGQTEYYLFSCLVLLHHVRPHLPRSEFGVNFGL